MFILRYFLDPCGGQTMFTENAGIIASPGYPEDYANDLDCRYTIKIGMKPMVVKLSFISLDIEFGPDQCIYDFLRIKDKRMCGTVAETMCK